MCRRVFCESLSEIRPWVRPRGAFYDFPVAAESEERGARRFCRVNPAEMACRLAELIVEFSTLGQPLDILPAPSRSDVFRDRHRQARLL